MPPLTISIMITTRNRISDLKRTCLVLLNLDPAPLEILITADDCSHGTATFVRESLPGARLFVNCSRRGSVASRDRMIRAARSDLVLSLDDDSYPEQRDCLKRIDALFRDRPRLAVAHFPQRSDEVPGTSRPVSGAGCLTRSFANSGAVLRRSIYLQLPGFEARFFHAYEEPDYALQCVAAEYEVSFCSALTIRHHYTTSERNELRTHQHHARNEFWSTVLRCPFPWAVAVAGYHLSSQFCYACKRGLRWAVREPAWWWRAVAGLPYCLRKRRPVPWIAYRKWLTMGS